MKTRFLILALGFSITVPAFAQDASHIARVTLYPGSATVERVAHVAAGARRLELVGLPAGFDAATIRVEADSGIRIGELSVRDLTGAEALSPRQAALEAKIEAIGDAIAKLDIERQSAELVTGYLKGLAGGEGRSATPSAKLAATIAEIDQGGRGAYGRIEKVARETRELERKKVLLQQELAKLAEHGHDSRSLTIALAAERAGELRISYQLSGPGWQPSYRASLDSASGEVRIELRAEIAQSSGEDWSNVSLRLSTGQPRLSPQGQEPGSWLVSLREPRPVLETMAMAAPAPAPAPLAKAARRQDRPLFEVSELQSEFGTEFEVPVPVSLPADGRRLSVSLSQITLPAKLQLRSAPRLEAAAYLVARLERPEGVWLPGAIQLYRDGAYVGSTRWSAQQGEGFELAFGRDDLLAVQLKPGRQLSGSGGLIGSRRERRIAGEYVLTNRHRQPVDLLLLEPTPVSGNEELKVETRITPEPGQRDWQGKPGLAAWELKLAPGASQSIRFDYRLSWPRDSQPLGF